MRFPNFATGVFLVLILTSFLSARVFGRRVLEVSLDNFRSPVLPTADTRPPSFDLEICDDELKSWY